jgi:hypothetical protein
MIENEIDDFVWSNYQEGICFRDKCHKWIEDLPWFNFSGTMKAAAFYSDKKTCEHAAIVSKLMRIQESLSDSDLKESIAPLVEHHRQLQLAYLNIYLAAMISHPSKKLTLI